jgi:hypothetical protein
MGEDDDNLIYLGVGPLAAIILGMGLVPLRGVTTASNFTFVFLILTIVVAELGGRWAAVATALCSALSLDFFLTKPYLRLTIDEKHDVIAFVGLAVCGVVAAVLGSSRSERIASHKNLELLHAALRQLEGAGPVEPRLTKVLDLSRAALPLSAAVIRDDRGQMVAASDRAHAMSVPAVILEPEILLAPGTSARDLPRRGPPFSKEGGRLPLVAGNRQVGWLDLWGTGAPANVSSRRTLSDVARLMAVLLAQSRPGPDPQGRERSE